MQNSMQHIINRRGALQASLFGLALATFAGTTTAMPGGDLVIEAGRIITQSAGEITDGVIVIRNGRIAAVGAADEVERPWDLPVVGGPEFTAFPGFVEAHTSGGMDRSNENIEVAPFLNIRDSIDPVSFFFEDVVRNGVTTLGLMQGNDCVVGARGMIVRPVGRTVEEMMVRGEFGLKLSASPVRRKSRATQAQALRRAFGDLRVYLEDTVRAAQDTSGLARREALYQGRELDEEESKGRAMGGMSWKVDGLQDVPRGELDPKFRPMLRLVEGRYAAFIYCGSPMDVHLALEIARDNGFLHRTTLVLDNSCWKAADIIAEAGVPVVLDSSLVHIENDPYTGKEIETFVPGVFDARGVRYALSSNPASSEPLWYQAALATGLGVSREAALDSVTIVPAEILGLGEQVGRIEVGFDGNVVLLTGDPLDTTSWIETVVVEGDAVYDRTTDTRNQYLYEGKSKAASSAPGSDR
ncbi:MAG: imidazolonepropionase-like amidohydrolase [Planctomycetota bacterium]|jgi:imidazolonepropionase-like amidohydrolase